ncbi:SAM-dependent methyltransferase [Mycolicibacterium sphagni]|uniref:SAM-dependent methyltransferase n=1 Tax=Mycolicibacterium sphagni TaxID=1786 RepID=UPI0021F2B738|nr:SAM-dependent methyltransferase [Mycolicibacterium sphagni]MCV7178131.1 SAM-dependent methyltransferase [Mycolicibacterium sphagni]
MARAEDDTWDITESVGATALGVAAGRAAETDSDNPLIRDPFAQMFLDVVGDRIPNLYARGEDLPPELVELDPRIGERMAAMRGYIASRTLFFDQFFLSAAKDGVRQSVILAAGLDARAWRLEWPAGSVVYELDQPKVLEFKVATLESHGATALTTHVGVPVDLRHDWPAALQASGFDSALPTAWSAEGLLPYLTAEAQDVLLERIASLSAPGSRVAVEDFTHEFFSAESFARREEQMQRYRAAAAKLGRTDIPESGNLLYEESRTQVVDWLAAHGWEAAGIDARDLMARNDRHVPTDIEDATPQSIFVEGMLPVQSRVTR